VTTTALVTGGSGYLALELIQQLLVLGDRVHATVRNLKDERKIGPLARLQQRFPAQLNLFEADLLTPSAVDDAMRDCRVVYHVASPFLLPERIKDPQRQMLEPALTGTRYVLDTVNKTATVDCVIFTSTIGAILGDYIDVRHMKDETLTENYFNTSSTLKTYPYHFAKAQAEREAWQMVRQQLRWRLVSINPGLILGPSLTAASDSGSLFLLDGILRGHHFYGLPDWSMATVDIREVAKAHIAAARNLSAEGRYILAEKNMTSLVEMSMMLRKVHKYPLLLPKNTLPNWLVMTFGPFWGLSREYMRKHLGICFKIDNKRSIEELGIAYRPIEETLIDHYRSWLELRHSCA